MQPRTLAACSCSAGRDVADVPVWRRVGRRRTHQDARCDRNESDQNTLHDFPLPRFPSDVGHMSPTQPACPRSDLASTMAMTGRGRVGFRDSSRTVAEWPPRPTTMMRPSSPAQEAERLRWSVSSLETNHLPRPVSSTDQTRVMCCNGPDPRHAAKPRRRTGRSSLRHIRIRHVSSARPSYVMLAPYDFQAQRRRAPDARVHCCLVR